MSDTDSVQANLEPSSSEDETTSETSNSIELNLQEYDEFPNDSEQESSSCDELNRTIVSRPPIDYNNINPAATLPDLELELLKVEVHRLLQCQLSVVALNYLKPV